MVTETMVKPFISYLSCYHYVGPPSTLDIDTEALIRLLSADITIRMSVSADACFRPGSGSGDKRESSMALNIASKSCRALLP